MKKVQLAELPQVFSFLQSERPVEAWAVTYGPPAGKFFDSGITHNTLESISIAAQHWTGWAFNTTTAFLLFENKEEAFVASVTYGECNV
jgi:hypothetical protein